MEATNTLGGLEYIFEHIAATLHRQSDQVLQERLGIGMSQYRILTLLQNRPNVQQRTLAATLGQTEAAISRQIKLLAGRGMLIVTINPERKREHITKPTAKGLKLTMAARDILDGYTRPVFTGLTPKQQQALLDALTIMHEHVCQPGKPYACTA